MSNGYLTTHVLDIYNGTPGKGIKAVSYTHLTLPTTPYV